MSKYKAVLFHPEGDYVTDFRADTKAEVLDSLDDMGSRWVFYPIAFVASDRGRIVWAPEGLGFLRRRKVENVARFLSNEWQMRADQIAAGFNAGAPLWAIY